MTARQHFSIKLVIIAAMAFGVGLTPARSMALSEAYPFYEHYRFLQHVADCLSLYKLCLKYNDLEACQRFLDECSDVQIQETLVPQQGREEASADDASTR